MLLLAAALTLLAAKPTPTPEPTYPPPTPTRVPPIARSAKAPAKPLLSKGPEITATPEIGRHSGRTLQDAARDRKGQKGSLSLISGPTPVAESEPKPEGGEAAAATPSPQVLEEARVALLDLTHSKVDGTGFVRFQGRLQNRVGGDACSVKLSLSATDDVGKQLSAETVEVWSGRLKAGESVSFEAALKVPPNVLNPENRQGGVDIATRFFGTASATLARVETCTDSGR